MRNLLKIEFKNCISRKEFKFIFLFLLFFSLLGFFISCNKFINSDLTYVRSAYELSFVQSIYSKSFLSLICMLLPVIACMIYSDTFLYDIKNGCYKNILIRAQKIQLIITKAIVVFTVTFGTFFITFSINQILSLIAFPVVGFDNNKGLPPYDIGVQNYTSGYLFDSLRISNPLLYNATFIFLISIFAACFALLGYALYFVIKQGKIAVISTVLVIGIGIQLLLQALNLREYSYVYLLIPGSKGSVKAIFLWLVFLIIGSFLIILIKGSKIEPEIEK